MRIVADTNIFLAIVLNEPEKGRLIQLTEGHHLIAPEVLPFELGNALTAMVKRKALKREEVREIWEILTKVPVDLKYPDLQTALKIALEFNIYAYDAYFLECAYDFKCPLLTLDRGMHKIAGEMGIKVLE